MSHIISIIVPVYNTEPYLARCIDSILSQSFTDFELLLVDDGSTDGSGAICDSYAAKDSRLRVFHKENGGVSSARNLGLDEAKGDWIIFVDSDDWVKEKYLEHLMDSNADLVVSGLQTFGASQWFLGPLESKFVPIYELGNHWNSLDRRYLVYPFVKRFRSSIIQDNNIRFNKKLFFSEDLCFVLSYLVFVTGIKEVAVADYQYFIPSVSRSSKYKMSTEQLKEHYEYHDMCLNALEQKIFGGENKILFIRKDVSNRLMEKLVLWLNDCRDFKTFYANVRLFRQQPWSKCLLEFIVGKKAKRIAYGAYYCPFLSYYFEKAVKWYRKIQKKVMYN